MKCPTCGRENRDVARFCQYCGALLPALAPAEGAPPVREEGVGVEQAVAAAGTDAAQPAGAAQPAALEAAAGDAEMEGEGEATYREAGSGELPVVGAEPPPAQPVEAGVDAVAATGMDVVEGAVVSSGSAELPGEAGEGAHEVGPTDESLRADEGALEEGKTLAGEEGAVEGEEALDEAEAEEALVPLEAAHGEPPPPEEEMSMLEAELRGADLLPWREEPPPSDVLEPGAVIDGRYRVVEALSIDGEDVLYSARDLQRCPQCGYDENSPDQAFCTACGAVMDRKPMVTVLQRPADREEVPGVELLDHLVEGERGYWVWEEPGKQTDVLGGSEEPMRMLIGQRTDPGQTRELNEDGLFALTMSYTYESVERASGLFIVADGMGGHEAGELASRICIRSVAGVVLRDVFAREVAGDEINEDVILAALERAVQVANEQVFLERKRRENDMGTTVTAALLREWTLYLAHIGDCRAYRWGEDGLQQLTTDHSVIASMVATGTAQPDEVYTHPHRSVIYRCVGDQPHVAVDTTVLSIEPGDRLVVCSDGLWEMLREDGIEDVLLREADPQRACNALVEAANEAGGLDNISVIVVQV